jgi:transposase-like protein
MSADLTIPEFTNEAAAMAHLEASRWPEGASCPHCGSVNVHRMAGKTQAGYWLCNDCRDKFTARTGSVMERSHIPVHKWLLAIHLLNSSKKGMSAHQLHRMLGITYKSAWFLAHRIREAMRDGAFSPMGGAGQTVEIDETKFGHQEGMSYKKARAAKARAGQFRNTVMTLVERGGRARSFHVDGTTLYDVLPVVRGNVKRETAIMTDEASWYKWVGREFASHDRVEHTAEEYVRREGEKVITTNTVEGYYSIFKRGMKGVYQHCSEKHLHRYLAEFDFRYNRRTALGYSDQERAAAALRGITGKRLTYRRPDKAANA